MSACPVVPPVGSPPCAVGKAPVTLAMGIVPAESVPVISTVHSGEPAFEKKFSKFPVGAVSVARVIAMPFVLFWPRFWENPYSESHENEPAAPLPVI